jgi:hypothetical protein
MKKQLLYIFKSTNLLKQKMNECFEVKNKFTEIIIVIVIRVRVIKLNNDVKCIAPNDVLLKV